MYNIEDINETLHRWAAWARQRENLGVKPLTIYDDGKSRGNIRYFPMSDDEGKAFDPAIALLNQNDKELGEWLRAHYIYGASYRDISKHTGINVAQVHAGMSQAKYFIVGVMQGRFLEQGLQKLHGVDSPFKTKSV